MRKAQVVEGIVGSGIAVIVAVLLFSNLLIQPLVESTSLYTITNETFNASMGTAHTFGNLPVKVGSVSVYCSTESTKTLSFGTNYTWDMTKGTITITSLGRNSTRDPAFEFGHYDCAQTSIGADYGYLKGAALLNQGTTTSENAVIRLGVIGAAIAILGLVVSLLV